MSAWPLPERARSATFGEDLNVLGGFAETYGFEPPVVRFGEDTWDFSAVPDRPAWLPAYSLVVRFDRNIAQPRWRLMVKELLCARLYPTHPAVVATIPNRRRRPAPLGEAYVRVLLYRRWLDWLDEHGIRSLGEVRQEHCDRYYNTRAREIAPNALSTMVILPLRELADYGPVLTDPYPDGFRPWGHRRACHITGVSTRRPNVTPVIPQQVLDPLLAGALFFVDIAGNDILTAREEHRRLSAPIARDGGNPASPAENLQRLAQTLDEYRREGRPLPLVRDLPPETVGDPLASVNLLLLGRQACLAKLSRLALSAEQRELLLDALDDLGTAPGGLRTPISEVIPFGGDGPPAPWRDPIGPWELRPLTARLAAACFCTIAALSGMRYSEIIEIRPGSIEPLDDGLGVIRWRLRSKLIKGQRHGGRPESWHVIAPVVDAITILERMHPNGPDDPLLTHDLCRTMPRPPDKPALRLHFGGLLRDLIAWQNECGARAGLPPIPEVDGCQWPIAPRQFRRTLAREIAFRPHGTIASKIQLKHVHAHVTEGYWGPAGESAQRFIDELDREQRSASEQRVRQRFEEWQQGLPIAGGAQHRLQQEFTVIARELDSFTGTLDEREQRLRKLLRKRAQTLHFGVLNDCHFTDPSQARCLKNAPPGTPQAPLIAACQPARCANASIHQDHLPAWRGVIAHAEELLSDPVLARKVPRQERERIAHQRDEHAAVISPLQTDA